MNNTDPLARVHEVITKGSLGTIVLPQNPSPDAIAAGSALYLALNKLGKTISFVCSSPVQSDLAGSDKIQTQMITSGDSLVVSFPYQDGAVDKVDYSIQGETFNLTIAPRTGFPKLDPANVKFSYTGGALDFIIVLDSPTLQSLGQSYTDNQALFQGRDIINIDRHLTNAQYGTVNYVNKTSSSISELVMGVLRELQAEVDKDIATNLYSGINSATNGLTSYSVNADTFEAVANLMRMGAVRKPLRKPGTTIPPTQSFNQQNNPISQPKPFFKPAVQGQQPIVNQTPHPMVPEEVDQNQEIPANKPQTPQEWLKPKIFKGSGLI